MLHRTIISEIGQNHCGSMHTARRLIDFAYLGGADLVKFQLYDSEKLYGYKQNTELTKEQASMLFHYGEEVGIEVFFSVFDKERIEWCEDMKVSHYKLSYAMSHSQFLVHDVLNTKVPVIMSSQTPFRHDNRISALYCIPKYPAQLSDLKFDTVDFTNDFQGYSDHTIGLHAAEIALARGAQIIEKHFAEDHTNGVDAPWSMTPLELRKLREFADSVRDAI